MKKTTENNQSANNVTFEERVAIAASTAIEANRETRLLSDVAINYELKKQSVKSMETLIIELTTMLDLDENKAHRFFKMARRSEYGRIPELIAKVATIYNWPIDSDGDANKIQDKQLDIIDRLRSNGIKVDEDLLMDLKEAKGSHSFLDKTTYKQVDAKEPDYESLPFLMQTFAEYANLTILDYKMNEYTWTTNERKAIRKIEEEKEAAKEALDKHKELQAS